MMRARPSLPYLSACFLFACGGATGIDGPGLSPAQDAGAQGDGGPVDCPRIYAPVCGEDGQTYGNACEAGVAGVPIAYEGECADCGGLLGGQCAADEWCDYDDQGPACGVADGAGTCRPRPEACPEYYAPVCGCDGQTYGNECFAAAGGTDVAFAGPCDSTGGTCGGFAGEQCSADEWCDYDDAGPACGAADGQGECKPRPQACYDVWDPVCGCDGQTHGNDCEAFAAGTDIAYAGPCDDGGQACGGWAGQTCSAEQYCEFQGDGCDWADAQGICEARPEVCPDNVDPVCGCDGRTYSNLCTAQQSGVDAAYAGPCR